MGELVYTPGLYESYHYPVEEGFDPYMLTEDGQWFEMNQDGWQEVEEADFEPFFRLRADRGGTP